MAYLKGSEAASDHSQLNEGFECLVDLSVRIPDSRGAKCLSGAMKVRGREPVSKRHVRKRTDRSISSLYHPNTSLWQDTFTERGCDNGYHFDSVSASYRHHDFRGRASLAVQRLQPELCLSRQCAIRDSCETVRAISMQSSNSPSRLASSRDRERTPKRRALLTHPPIRWQNSGNGLMRQVRAKIFHTDDILSGRNFGGGVHTAEVRCA